MRKNGIKLAGGVLAVSLIAMACSSSDDDSGGATTAGGGATTTAAGTAAPATTGGAESTSPSTAGSTTSTTASGGGSTTTSGGGEDVTKWALDYTGGTAAAASGDPIKIGYVNQESFFPEATVGIDAAVEFANKELGGIGGRPIQIERCEIAAPEDGTKCGNQFANDPSINLVMTGTILNGNKELYEALDGKKVVLIGNGVNSDDFTTPAGVGFQTGAPGVIPGLAKFSLQYLDPKPTSVAVVFADNPAGHAGAEVLLKPTFEANGVTDIKLVPVADTATAADVQSAMTVAGAETADVFIPLVTVQNCINVYDAIQALGINPRVVTTGLCFGTPMTDHLKQAGSTDTVPDGWYFGGYGYSYFLPDYDSGMKTYVDKVHEYGKKTPGASTLEYTGFGGPMFANLLTAVKLSNQIGVDTLSYDTLNTATRGFTGPTMMQAGPLACGKTVIIGLPLFVSVCANQMGVQQYKDGKWVSVADALNGKEIDVTDAKVG
jgi:branched-chain amino acid transport system substrate-binding protein